MKKLLLLAFLMAGIALFPSTDLFAQQDTIWTDTLWSDDFDDGDCDTLYQWNAVNYGGVTTIDCATGQMVVSTSVSGTGVIAYGYGNLLTDVGDYRISCKARVSDQTGYGDFSVYAKQDISGTKSWQVKFTDYEGGTIWIYEGYSAQYLSGVACSAIVVDQFFNAKVAVSGDMIAAKAWHPDSTEPYWQLAYTTASVPGGYKDLWRGVQVGGYWIDSITVDDFVVYGPPYCDWASGDVNGDYQINLADALHLAKYYFGWPGFDAPVECPSGR